MKEYNYSITINKPIDFVFNKMTDKSIYGDWAKAWGEGMTYKGEWSEGSYIVFHDDKGGTKAEIKTFESNKAIKMEHVGMVGPDSEDLEPSDEAMKKWTGSLEEYSFKEDGDEATIVEVRMVTDEMFEQMTEGAWPKALEFFKELCEK